MRVWSRNYYQIVERYEGTIKAQFFGHTHGDEFSVFYDTKEHRKLMICILSRLSEILKFSERPTSVAYIGPSVTPFVDFNPAYRLYYVDGDHGNSTFVSGTEIVKTVANCFVLGSDRSRNMDNGFRESECEE